MFGRVMMHGFFDPAMTARIALLIRGETGIVQINGFIDRLFADGADLPMRPKRPRLSYPQRQPRPIHTHLASVVSQTAKAVKPVYMRRLDPPKQIGRAQCRERVCKSV